jgi:hypothetical protein
MFAQLHWQKNAANLVKYLNISNSKSNNELRVQVYLFDPRSLPVFVEFLGRNNLLKDQKTLSQWLFSELCANRQVEALSHVQLAEIERRQVVVSVVGIDGQQIAAVGPTDVERIKRLCRGRKAAGAAA